MYRGTTPPFQINVDGVNLSDYPTLQLSISQDDVLITKDTTDMNIEGNVIKVTLTQNDTLSLDEGMCELQLRGLSTSGVAIASDTTKIKVSDILSDGEIYG